MTIYKLQCLGFFPFEAHFFKCWYCNWIIRRNQVYDSNWVLETFKFCHWWIIEEIFHEISKPWCDFFCWRYCGGYSFFGRKFQPLDLEKKNNCKKKNIENNPWKRRMVLEESDSKRMRDQFSCNLPGWGFSNIWKNNDVNFWINFEEFELISDKCKLGVFNVKIFWFWHNKILKSFYAKREIC